MFLFNSGPISINVPKKQKKPYETSPRAPAKDRLHLSTLEVLHRNRSTSPGLTDLQMIKYMATFIFVSVM